MTSFKYLYELQATSQLDIEDCGNCAIIAYNTIQYKKYILIVKTIEGQTRVVISGPHWAELEQPCLDYIYSYQSFQYSQSKIEKIIERFLNTTYCISQAECVEFEDAIKHIPDVREFIINDY